MKKTIIVAFTGASGVIYGLRLLKALLEQDTAVILVISQAGKQVLRHEAGYKGGDFERYLEAFITHRHPDASLTVYEETDFFAPPASGSFRHDGMVIAPCTMGTLGAIAAGTAGNLIHRAADVCMKEKLPLILLPRETPFNLIHIENMMKAAQAGATLMPPCPSFYSMPETINQLVDTLVARILDHLDIPQHLIKPWGTPHERD